MNSLRAKLTVALLLVTASVGLLATAAVYLDARQEIEELFDYELRAVAEAIDPHDAARPRGRAVGRLPDDDVLVQVWSPAGQLVYRSDPARTVPRPVKPGYETLASPRPEAVWRSYSLAAGDAWIQVAQSLETRRELAFEQTLRLLAPGLLALPLLGALIGWVVKRNLAPVRELGDALAHRMDGSTDPVPSAALPHELVPLVAGFNKMLERLAKAMAAQRALVADAAHELRTPLAAVRLQAQHLERLQDPDERAAAHTSLAQGIERMTRLVAQLLTLARLEPEAARDGTTDRVRLDTLAREMLAELIPFANARGIELSLACEEGVELAAELAGLRALVGNLVDNALRYTPAAGAVVVTVSRRANDALLVVSDNGPGLAAGQRELVLQRFYRVPGSPGDGSGLGLAIASAVVQRQGGTMALLEAEGGGLRVEVVLPAAGPAHSSTPNS